MTDRKIIDQECFIKMPLSAQALYFHLDARSDGDGFVGNYKLIQQMIGATEGDLALLMSEMFVVSCDSGVMVIKNGRIHKLIQSNKEGVSAPEPDEDEQLKETFETLYAFYPKKVGKTKAFTRYKAWVKTGRSVNGKRVKLTNAQIWEAISSYKQVLEDNGTDLKFYKNFDTFMGDSILDYLEDNQ